MFPVDLFLALVVAIVLSLVLVAVLGWRHPARDETVPALFFVFFMIFPAAWAVGVWMVPFGPTAWGATWLPFVVIGLLVAFVIAAAVPGPGRRGRSARHPSTEVQERLAAEQEEVTTGVAIFGLFFWLVMLASLVAIVAAYV
jgi:hypothetical protein